jgi:hypothetical protein
MNVVRLLSSTRVFVDRSLETDEVSKCFARGAISGWLAVQGVGATALATTWAAWKKRRQHPSGLQETDKWREVGRMFLMNRATCLS